MNQVFNKFAQKVDKSKVKKDIESTLEKNDNAIDFFTNELNRAKDRYAYTDSEQDKEEINNLEYAVFCFSFLDKQYREALKKC